MRSKRARVRLPITHMSCVHVHCQGLSVVFFSGFGQWFWSYHTDGKHLVDLLQSVQCPSSVFLQRPWESVWVSAGVWLLSSTSWKCSSLLFWSLCSAHMFFCLFVLFSMYAIVSCCMSSFSLSLFPSALLWYCHVSFCLFVFLCHGFVILLLVFHIITSWTACVLKELIFQFRGLTTFQIPAPQKRRTTYPRGPHGQRRKILHGSHGMCFFFSTRSLSGSHAEGWVCFQAACLHSSRSFGFGNFLSLISFDLLLSYFQLDCIILCYLAFWYHS